MASPPRPLMPDSFLADLKERKLVQWTAAYLAAAWLVYEALSLIGQNFGWPVRVLQLLGVALGVGLLATVVLAWFHGEKGEQRVGGVELLMLATLLLIAATGVAWVGGAASPVDAPAAAAGPTGGVAGTDGTPDARSVAVLPFADMSRAGDQEYFSDGLTEELLNVLVQVPGLRVPARTSSFVFKGRNVDVREIGRQLGVAHVLEGSVRLSGEQFRITAQLIDVRTGYHLWSETYDRRLSDVFAVQEEIARAIADALRLELTGEQETRLVRGATHRTEAHQLYLRGLHLWNRRRAEDLRQAIEYFEQAVALDPEYARAHVGLAQSWLVADEYIPGLDARAAADRARAAVERALELDPELPSAYAVLGSIESIRLQPDAAEGAFRRALALNPNDATARQWYSQHLLARLRFEEALDQARQALALDPLSLIINNNLGLNYYYQQRWDEAIAAYRATLELDPSFPVSRRNLAVTLLAAGRYEEAREMYEEFGEEAERWRVHPFLIVARARADGSNEARDEALRSLRNLPVADGLLRFQRARAYALLGAEDEAVADIEEFARSGRTNVRAIAARPLFADLHDHPTFQAIIDRLGLPRR